MSIKNKKMKDKKSWIIFRGNNSLFWEVISPIKYLIPFINTQSWLLTFFLVAGFWFSELENWKSYPINKP